MRHLLIGTSNVSLEEIKMQSNPRPGSPNQNWLDLGAEVVRNGYRRTILLRGEVVCVNAGYDCELAISKWLLFLD